MLVWKTLRRFSKRPSLKGIPSLNEFIRSKQSSSHSSLPYDYTVPSQPTKPTYFMETHGCQMNVSDSEIIRTILNADYVETREEATANIVLINTCSIREKAEEKIHARIATLKPHKIIGILGCMAERIKKDLFQEGASLVCGPDSYRALPDLIHAALNFKSRPINTKMDFDQTYSDVLPTRDQSQVTAMISIMRGCNNMCSFCIVPFVRGRERSRTIESILNETAVLQKQGVKDIMFLGQNVNSYHDSSVQGVEHQNTKGFEELFKLREGFGARFEDLIEQAALRFPNVRFRFTSPHPKNFPDRLLHVIAKHHNILKTIHLPAQSGNDAILQSMRRYYTRNAYLELVQRIRAIIPGVTLSTDLICGFCGETEQQFEDTLSLLREVKYDRAFLYSYSMRKSTHAYHTLKDDVAEEVKLARVSRMIDLFIAEQGKLNKCEIGKIHLVLVANKSKEKGILKGQTGNGKNAYLREQQLPYLKDGSLHQKREFGIGDYVAFKVTNVGPRALYGQPLYIADTLGEFYAQGVGSEEIALT